MIKEFKKALIIPIAIVAAGLLVAGAIIYINQGKISGSLAPQKAAEKAIDYINKNLVAQGIKASLIDTSEKSGVYKIHIKVGEREYDSYVTKDGKLLFIEGINLEPASSEDVEKTKEIPKRDTPDVKLFVMSYCPYGLQMQKAFLPVYNLLKDKAKMGVYFVDYIMHGKKEIDENLRQYCIQKEQKERYSDYLSCFVKDGDFEKCLIQTQIDKTKITSCISTTDNQYNITAGYNDKSSWLNGNYPRFDIYKDLNEKYGVKGSPTLIINDKEIQVSQRSPETLKEVICQAFNSPPGECSQELSTNVTSAGFGEATGSNSGGGCGQ
jgi:hypothetical protein